jgi:hypothetical protein
MSTYHPVEGIKVEVGPDMGSTNSRIARGVKVAELAKQSPLYAEPEVKLAVDSVIAGTDELKGDVDDHSAAQAALALARSGLEAGITRWDGSYRVLVAAAEKHCGTADECASLGLRILGNTKHPLIEPLAIGGAYNLKKEVLCVRVTRAPGLRNVCVQMTLDPNDPTSWVELPGLGAVHEIKNPAPGTYWFRAASRRARDRSDFTTPVSVIVK